MVDSLFLSKFYSKALIIIPPYENSKFVHLESTGIRDSEQYFLMQRKALSSDKVLRDAISAFNPKRAITATAIESLRSDLSAERLPFDNSVVLSLETSQPNDAGPLLRAIIQSYENWFRDCAVTEANRLKNFLLQELNEKNRQLFNADHTLKTFNRENGGALLAKQLLSKKEAIENVDSQIQKLKSFQAKQQDQSERNINKDIVTNSQDYHFQIFNLLDRRIRIMVDIPRLTQLETIRHSLENDVGSAEHTVRQISVKVNDINFFLSRSSHISIKIMNLPSIPKQINPLWLNLIYGVTTGICLSFLLLYLMTIQTDMRRGHSSNDEM